MFSSEAKQNVAYLDVRVGLCILLSYSVQLPSDLLQWPLSCADTSEIQGGYLLPGMQVGVLLHFVAASRGEPLPSSSLILCNIPLIHKIITVAALRFTSLPNFPAPQVSISALSGKLA